MARLYMKRRWLWCLGALLALAAVAILLLPRAPALPAPSEALLNAAQGLDDIAIEAKLLPESGTLTVTQRLRLTSRAGESRDTLVLRTWPNAFQSPDVSPCALEESYDRYYPAGFSIGGLVMHNAQAAISEAELTDVRYRYADEAKTALTLPLPEPWQPGAALTVTLSYEVIIPNAAYRFGVSNDLWALGNAFAIPAVWENGAYRTDPYYPIGDPFMSDPANYTVSLTVPAGYTCAASGYPVAESADNAVLYRFSALAVRDFALTVSRSYHAAQKVDNGVLISAYAKDAGQASQALSYAQAALKVYSELYGAYPYQSLSLGEITFPHSGMEYPAMIMLSSDVLKAGGTALEYAVAHEVAHQWWYAVVGSDSVNQAWQDEALCEYSLLDYVEARYGQAAREELYQTRLMPSMRVTMPRGITPGSPLDYFSSMGQYATLVYERGGAMLYALDQLLDGGMDGFLRQYYERFQFQRASREDFTSLLSQATGVDAAPLMIDYLDTHITP